MDQLNWKAEIIAFVLMLGLSVIIGLYYGFISKQNTVTDYLLGGKQMSVFPIAMSLIASHISGVTLLGVPSEIYTHGTQYIINGAITLIVILITLYVFLPVFYELQLTSVYKYLELRFDSKIRSICSLIFAAHLIIYLPLVIYVPALAFKQVTGINVYVITWIICAVCIFYTTIGGLKAVVWTYVIQSFFTAISILLVIILGYIQVGGIGNIIKANQESGRIEIFNMDLNPFLRNTFWTVSVGSTLTWLTALSIHPGTSQRFVALPSYNKARKALIYFIIGLVVVNIVTCVLGMLIYTKYKDCDPALAKYITSNKNLLPFYVMDVAGKFPGLTGLFISGIISTSLSAMAAQLNTVAATIYEDFIVKMIGVRVSDLKARIIMKSTVVVVGAICVVLVMVVEKLQGIVDIAVSVCGITAGPILSVYTLGVCFPRANSRGAMWGMLTSLGIMTWIAVGAQIAIYNNDLKFTTKNVSTSGCPAGISLRNHTNYYGLYQMNKDVYVSPNVWKIYTVSYMHYSTIGFLVGMAVGLAVSLLFPTDQCVDPKLLAPWLRKSTHSKFVTDAPQFNGTREMTPYQPVSQNTTEL